MGAEPAPEPLQPSSSRTRAEPEPRLSGGFGGPRRMPRLSLWSVPETCSGERFPGSTRTRSLTTKSHLARAEPAPEPPELSSSRNRAEPEPSRSGAGPSSTFYPASQPLVCQKHAPENDSPDQPDQVPPRMGHLPAPDPLYSTPTLRAPWYGCGGSSSCRGTNAVDDATPPPIRVHVEIHTCQVDEEDDLGVSE